MEISRVDGVTVLTSDRPGPLTASLIFGAGVVHATYRTVEVPHLLEHMILGSLPRVRHDTNGSTGPELLTFDATGTPEEVRTFLERVCAAIRDLPLDRLAHEARVVEAEGGCVAHPLISGAARMRYGLRGAGLVGGEGVPPHQITAEQIRDFSQRHLVSGNAVLVLTGPVPPGLHLDLPDGERATFPDSRRHDLDFPSFDRLDAPQPLLDVEAPDSRAALRMGRIWNERATDVLRHELGVSYAVELVVTTAGPGRVLLGITADGDSEDVERIAEGLVSTLRDLAHDGPTSQEMSDDLEGYDRYRETHDSTLGFLEAQAGRVLDGLPTQTPEEARAEMAAITADEVRQVARDALSTAHLVVDVDTWGDRPAPSGFRDSTDEEWEDRPETGGRTFAKKLLGRGPRNLRFRVGDEAVSVRAGDRTQALRWDEIVGIDTALGYREITAWDTRTIAFRVRDMRDGDELAHLLLERLPALHYSSADD